MQDSRDQQRNLQLLAQQHYTVAIHRSSRKLLLQRPHGSLTPMAYLGGPGDTGRCPSLWR